jgi:putative salt-induced outer membrane protein YdiY
MNLRHIITLTSLTCCFSAFGQDSGSEEEKKTFTLDGELGIIVTTGNTSTSSFSGRLSAHHELTKWSNDYGAEFLYRQEESTFDDGTEESVTTAQKLYISGQANYKLENENNRLFGFASYEDDRFNGFDFQSSLALGWNQQLWNTPKSSFAYSVGPGYSFADTIDGEDNSSLIVRSAANFQYQISDSASFKQDLSTEVGSENTKSKSETSLSTRINGALSMKFSIILNHNTDVAFGLDNLDTQTAVTVVYTFF